LTLRAERLWAGARYTGADLTAMQVEVTGVQFAWYFRYPGDDGLFGRTDPGLVAAGEGNPLGLDANDVHAADDIVSSELVLPAGREVDLRLRAQDVIHGFSVPEMRLKQNAVPGQTIHIHFTPTAPGNYAILCTQVCGLGHYRMSAGLRVVTPEEFAAWLARHGKAARR
jgi:cytochrome c oxidase subunit 2